MRFTHALTFIALAFSAREALASGYTFSDVVAANSSDTLAFGINNSGAVAGWYCPSGVGCPVAYTDVNGTFSTFNPVGSIGDYGLAIGNNGTLVGQYVYYQGTTQVYTGFEYSGGSYTTIADPNGTDTQVRGINESGTTVGLYYDSTIGQDLGFVDQGGVFSNVVYPGGSDDTLAFGINDSGEVVGAYETSGGAEYGFSELNGVYTTIDVPGSEYTEAFGINNEGVIAGTWADAGGTYGFIDDNGVFTTISEPGTTFYTQLQGINDSGELVGDYENSSDQEIGFTAAILPTPEPDTIWLMIGGALLCAIGSRKRRISSREPVKQTSRSTGNVLFLSLFLCAVALVPAQASTVQLIANGTFESGNLTGWTNTATPFADTTGSCNDQFAAATSGSGCVAGLGPVDGLYDADTSATFPSVADTDGEWDDSLSQNFVVPTGDITDAEAQFDATATCRGTGTFRGCGVLVALFDGGTFIANDYALSDPGGNVTLPWSTYDWDITTDLTPYEGDTLTLELLTFTFFDTRSDESYSSATEMNAAFDDVELNVTTATPEPIAASLIGGGLLLIACLRRLSTSATVD